MLPQTLLHGNNKNEIRQKNKKTRSAAGAKLISPDGLNYPNQNSIIISIICLHIIRVKKYNKIQLINNKMGSSVPVSNTV